MEGPGGEIPSAPGRKVEMENKTPHPAPKGPTEPAPRGPLVPGEEKPR